MSAASTEISESAAMCDLSAVLGLSQPAWASGANLDSRAIVPGDAFVALPGATAHGLSFIRQAQSNGAVMVLVDAEDAVAQASAQSVGALPIMAVVALRSKLGALARALYSSATGTAPLIGVTGTDGKTSITHFVAQLMSDDKASCAVLGTVGNGFLHELQSATHTTADVFQVYRQLQQLQARGASAVAMEVSSHALDQDRVAELTFDVAVLSNLGSDHLDYHGNVSHYADAKARLFDARAKHCVLNIDDEFGRRLFAQRPDAVSYSAAGAEGARWQAQNCRFDADGIQCLLGVPGEMRDVSLPLLGAFNVANVLAACAVAELCGRSVSEILSRLSTLQAVRGRAELLRSHKGSRVVVDYAHTAQALSSILSTLRDHFHSRIFCVFGCGGDRDRGKRAAMARAAEKGADVVVVTSDNPRSEDPQRIIDDVLDGFSGAVEQRVQLDRALAIADALESATEQDCVLVAGKGHEDYQLVGARSIPFSDRDHVLSWRGEEA